MRPFSRLHFHQSAVWVHSGSLGMLKWWSELFSYLQTLMCLQQLCPQRAGWGAVCGTEMLLSSQFWDPWLELFIFKLFRNKGLNTRAADCCYSVNVPSPSRREIRVYTPLFTSNCFYISIHLLIYLYNKTWSQYHRVSFHFSTSLLVIKKLAPIPNIFTYVFGFQHANPCPLYPVRMLDLSDYHWSHHWTGFALRFWYHPIGYCYWFTLDLMNFGWN